MNFLETINKEVTNLPEVVLTQTLYLTRVGSKIFGADVDTSDDDYAGFCKPSMDDLFPFTNRIYGFGSLPSVFEQYQKEHLVHDGKEFDLCVYSLVKVASMAYKGAPNATELLFCDNKHALITSPESDYIKSHAKYFVSKASCERMYGFAKAEYKKMLDKDAMGVDYTKSAYHVVRLFNQVKYLLTHGELVLDEHSSLLKNIRSGVYEFNEIVEMVDNIKNDIAFLEGGNKMPEYPDYDLCHSVLYECLMNK